MIQSIEKSAKTVEEATVLALSELNATEENVDIDILEYGNKGLFGIIGNKMARVKVTLKESMGEKAKNFLFEILNKMGAEVDIQVEETEDDISLNVHGSGTGIIIGRRGETLDSLQYLTNLVVNKDVDKYKKVFIDIESYRKKREETLVKLANRLAEKVIRTRRSVTLEPMNPYERRIIHSTLQNNNLVKTHSVGDEPYRKIVINIK